MERPGRACWGTLAFAALLCLLAPAASAWSGSDGSYDAFDDVDGGPTPAWSTYDYESSTGWTCDAAMNVDNGATGNVKPTGFDFDFYGAPITGIWATSDGFLTFTSTSFGAADATALPDSFTPNGVIAPWWGDLYPNAGARGYLCYRVTGSGSSEVFEYLIDNTRHFTTPATARINAVALLHEENGVIEFHYGDTTWLADGYSEVVGLEDPSGTVGLQYLFTGTSDATAIDADNRAVQFRPTGVHPAADDDSYTLDWSLATTLKVDGSTDRAKLVANDSPVGRVPLHPDYVSGLSATERLYTLASGTCGSTSPSLSTDGQFCWTTTDADPCETGPYEFTYHTDDAYPDDPGTGDEATVTITVINCNAEPEAVADTASATEDTQLAVDAEDGVLANDSDDDGDDLTATLVAGSETPAGAVVDLEADGSYTYTPPQDACGPTTGGFRYLADDGTDTSEATVTITISCTADTPVANADAYVATEDTALVRSAALGVRLNDRDPDDGRDNADGNDLADTTVVLDFAPTHGTLTLGTDGSFTYTPAADFNGADSFGYFLRDANTGLADRTSDSVVVNLTVAAVNDAPRSQPDRYELVVDEVLEVDRELGVLQNDTEADGDAVTVELVSPTHAGSTIELSSDGSFTYTPEAGSTSPDFFTYRTRDTSGVYGPTTRVDLRILVPNPDLIARADRYTATEDVALTHGSSTGLTAADTITHRSDPLEIRIDTHPDHGTLAWASDGSFTYTPDANYNGLDSFTYHLEQAGHGVSNVARVSITVASANDAPAVRDVTYACFAEDTVLSVAGTAGLLSVAEDDHAGAPDEDDTPLRVASWSPPSHGVLAVSPTVGSFTYTPAGNYNGPDAFTFEVADAHGARRSATATLCVSPANDAPTAAADTVVAYKDLLRTIAAPGPLANDGDIDGDTLRIAPPLSLTGSQGGRLDFDTDGRLSYIPPTGYVGLEDFAYRATDGTANSAPATIRFDVRFNTAPVAAFEVPARVTAGQVLRAADRSSDADGPIVARAWDFGSSAPPGIQAPEHAYPYPGTYTVRLTVWDEAGAWATTARSIVVEAPPPAPTSQANSDPMSSGHRDYTNQDVQAMAPAPDPAPAPEPPQAPEADLAVAALVADAGAPATVDEGATVRLLGAATGGTAPYTFSWEGPAGLAIAGAGLQEASFRAPAVTAAQALAVTLTVTDATGAVDRDETIVTVRNVPAPPTVEAADRTALAGTVRLEAVVANATSVAWRQVSGPAVELVGATGASPTFVGPPGEYVFEVTATNADGTTTRTVRVAVAGQAAPGGDHPAVQARSVPTQAGGVPWMLVLGVAGAAVAVALLAAIVWAARRPRA